MQTLFHLACQYITTTLLLKIPGEWAVAVGLGFVHVTSAITNKTTFR
jgi:hypothetical protein